MTVTRDRVQTMSYLYHVKQTPLVANPSMYDSVCRRSLLIYSSEDNNLRVHEASLVRVYYNICFVRNKIRDKIRVAIKGDKGVN